LILNFIKKNFSKRDKDPEIKALESLINKAMDYDPSTRSCFTNLIGKILKIECTTPNLSMYILFKTGSIQLKKQHKNPADLKLKGTGLSFTSLYINIDEQVSFFDSGINVSGDQEMLRQLQKLFKNLDIDWEAALADIIGDIPAYAVAKSLRSSHQWKKKILKQTTLSAIEFAQEEIKVIPNSIQADGFGDAIKKLQNEVERIGMRVDRLAAKLKNLAQTKLVPRTKKG
jgi:ubiquinone biosynthesis protein UbiJ